MKRQACLMASMLFAVVGSSAFGKDEPNANMNSATTVTTNDILHHFMVWNVDNVAESFSVDVDDQFMEMATPTTLDFIDRLSNPADKDMSGEFNANQHLIWHKITAQGGDQRGVRVTNQLNKRCLNGDDDGEKCQDNSDCASPGTCIFVKIALTLKKNPAYLLTPAAKKHDPDVPGPIPVGLDHFLCYEVTHQEAEKQLRDLADKNFETTFDGPYAIGRPRYFCNPVEKTLDAVTTPIGKPANDEDHLVFYEIVNPIPVANIDVRIHDQFYADQPLTAQELLYLGVPTNKIAVYNTGIPAVSEWGMVTLVLLVLSAGTVVLVRRRGMFTTR